MQDYISDMITRIRNGQRAQLGAVVLHPMTPHLCLKILHILCEEGYIRGVNQQMITIKKKNYLVYNVLLKYDARGIPAISSIFRVSKISRRIFVTLKSLWKPKNTGGFFILSTPQGLLIDRDARIKNLGGEIICGVY